MRMKGHHRCSATDGGEGKRGEHEQFFHGVSPEKRLSEGQLQLEPSHACAGFGWKVNTVAVPLTTAKASATSTRIFLMG
jgi:hypothetical protein